MDFFRICENSYKKNNEKLSHLLLSLRLESVTMMKAAE